MTDPADDKVNELRQQLRALGYLDAGVDRFLLAPAYEVRHPTALAVRASLRVGVLGGVLLGPAAAIGVASRVPGLISGARDAFVIALYLAVVFFIALAATAFVTSLAARALVRAPDAGFAARARVATEAIRWTIALGCLTYLTFWWRTADAGFGWSAPLWTLFALAVAVAISLLVGHAVRITALAVLAAGRPVAAMPRVPPRSWRIIVAAGTLALAGASALLLATAAPGARGAGAPELLVIHSRAPIRLIALDGFDPATFATLRGTLPNLRYLLGGRQLTLEPQNTSDPARAWTTIATGVTPDVHGVHALETRRLTGLRGVVARTGRVAQVIATASDLLRLTQPSLVTSEQRQAKTIWEVADQAGLRTAVVN
ncbi:MAG: alkaline phosphatase family protein, partial [Vicinamibacterales bacterium]